MKHDQDLKGKSPAELRRAIMSLRRQIRKVRDARDDEKCWTETVRLYLLLPEKKLPDGFQISKDPEILLDHCRRYWPRQCAMNELAKLAAMQKR